jgi:hypothetical protein
MKSKIDSNSERAGVAVDAPVRPIDIALELARHPINDLERVEIGQGLIPHLEPGENVDTGALRILALAHSGTNRVFNRYGAANTDFADEIDKIINPAMQEIVAYCSINNVDLRDAMGYCVLHVTNRMCEAGLRNAMRMRKSERHSSEPNDQEEQSLPGTRSATKKDSK